MGFFSDIDSIRKINTLLKTIEPKITVIQNECGSLRPNVDKIQIEARTICVIMNEILEIADSSGESVRTATYFFFNEKIKLIEISKILAQFISMCDELYINSFK